MTDGFAPPDGCPPVLLGTDTTTDEQVYLPYDVRPKGVDIVGRQGTGKSSLLERMILADLEHGTAGMVIDPHGSLVERVMQYATPGQAERIRLLEADSSAPFGLNLLEVRKTTSLEESIAWSADIVVSTIKKLYGQADEFLPRLENYLDLAVRTLIPNNGTLARAPRLFRKDDFRRQCLKNVTDEDVLDEWARYDAMRKVDQEGQIESVINRLRRMLGHPLVKGIFGSQKTTVPYDEILNGDSMVLVSLPAQKISTERCDFIGALLLSALADRVFARNVSCGLQPRIHVYVDEVQRFATPTTKTLLEEGRKFNVGLTMAHQTIAQVRDAQIRDAARLVGTLIALWVIRPDADELAGEFPVKARPERIEMVEDGTEPVYVLSPTPAEDVYLEPHDDPDVDMAGKSFLAFSPVDIPDPDFVKRFSGFPEFNQPDKRKSAGVPPRPGGVPVDGRVKLTASDVQNFLVRAMAGELPTDELMADALLDTGQDIYRPPEAVYFKLRNESPALVIAKTCLCPPDEPGALPDYRRVARTERIITEWKPPCQCEIYRLSAADKVHDETVKRIFRACAMKHLERLRGWLLTYLADRDALRAGEMTEALKRADAKLIAQSALYHWDELWKWTDPLSESSSGDLQPSIRMPPPSFVDIRSLSLTKTESSMARDSATAEAIDILRERLRWLVILADGLAKSPLWITNGQQRPRFRPIRIPAQSQDDALAEFAAKLVNPPGDYIAQVRILRAYHQVKLRPDLDSDARDGGQRPGPNQPDAIRRRSRALYSASEHQAVVVPLVQPVQPRRVTRTPRPQQTPEERQEQ